MKAVVLEANEVLKYRDVPEPPLERGSVRIKVAVCGICGSDIPRVYNHGARNYPIVLGHEFSGIVDRVGENVTKFSKGDHVVAAPLLPCGVCESCKKGNYSLCEHYSFIGSRQNGAMADYVVVPEANLVKIPDNISMEQAATIEPSSVALHAFKISRFVSGRSVAVIGCGIIGLFAVQWARILGASNITAIGRGQSGLDAALRVGADCALSTLDLDRERLDELKVNGFDYVFECSGADETMHLAIEVIGKKGTICFIGTPKQPLAFTVPQWEIVNRKECWITGSWMSYSMPFPGEEWIKSVQCMSSGELRNDSGMIYGVYPMSHASEAFKTIRSGVAKGRVLLKNDFDFCFL